MRESLSWAVKSYETWGLKKDLEESIILLQYISDRQLIIIVPRGLLQLQVNIIAFNHPVLL